MRNETSTFTGTFATFLRGGEQTTLDVIDKLIALGIDDDLIEVKNNEILLEIPDIDDDKSVGCSLNDIRTAVKPAIVEVFDELFIEREYDWGTIDTHKERIYL